jgi:hypothetical protein
MTFAESVSFSDFIDRGRCDDFGTCSFDDGGFFPDTDEDFRLLVNNFDGFREDFCECLVV